MQLISGSHDGSIKVWDIKKISNSATPQSELVHLYEVQDAPEKKYDEGVQALAVHPSQPFVASGGSDSIVKVLEIFM